MTSGRLAVDPFPAERTARPVKPSPARERILATASRLFYGTGIRAVGVDRVIAESQVARMTFFRHFPTKDHLVVAFLENQAAIARSELLQVKEQDGPRGVLAWVIAGVRSVPTSDGFRGCEFVNTAAEFSDPGHPARLVVAQHRGWIRDQLGEALAALDHPTPTSTAELLLMLRTGAIIATSLEGLDSTGPLEHAWQELVDSPAPGAALT